MLLLTKRAIPFLLRDFYSWLIIFYAAEDGEALNSQQKPDWELSVAQIMNFLL